MSIRLTPAIKGLLIACFASFLIQQTGDQFFGTQILDWFGLIPRDFIQGHRYWQVFTYAFLHGDVMHLFFNLLLLAFIGSELEMVWGARQFLKYYFFCAVSSGVVYVIIQYSLKGGYGLHVPMVGASGAIYGLLMAFGLLFGERVLLFMLLFPVKAKHFVILLGLFELMTTFYSTGRGIASIAHVAGMVAGFGYLWARARYILLKKQRLSPSASSKRLKKRRSKHLKLIVSNPNEDDSEEDPTDKPPQIWH